MMLRVLWYDVNICNLFSLTLINFTLQQNCVSSNAGYKIPCPQEKPYCVVPSAGKATCSSTPSEECAPALPPFQCTSIGIFPDPSKFYRNRGSDVQRSQFKLSFLANCEIYYNCYEENPRVIRAEPLYCPPGYLFNPDSTSKQYCLLASTPSDCVTVTGCEGATTSKIVPINFTNSTLFVALCIPGSQPWIFQCKSDFGRYSCFMQFSL